MFKMENGEVENLVEQEKACLNNFVVEQNACDGIKTVKSTVYENTFYRLPSNANASEFAKALKTYWVLDYRRKVLDTFGTWFTFEV